jgi:hypothetical protein
MVTRRRSLEIQTTISNNLLKLTSQLNPVYNVITTLNTTLLKSDRLQIQSLATGTSLNRLLSDSNSILKGLKGSYFDNARELLQNLQYGLENTDESILKLQNRMLLTGQSTDVLRQSMGFLQAVFMDNKDSTKGLASVTETLMNTYKISIQQLVSVVNEFKDEITSASFFGGGNEITNALFEIKAIAKEAGDQVLVRDVKQLLNQSITDNALYGTGDVMSKIISDQSGRGVDIIFDALQKKASTIKGLTQGMSPEIVRSVLANSLPAFSFTAERSAELILNRRRDLTRVGLNDPTDSIKGFQDNLLGEMEKVSSNFYKPILSNVEQIATTLVIFKTGTFLNYLAQAATLTAETRSGRRRTIQTKTGKFLGRAGMFLVKGFTPLAIGITALQTFFPSLLDFTKKSAENNKITADTNKELLKIERDKIKSNDTNTVLESATDVMLDMVRNIKSSQSESERNLRTNEKILEYLNIIARSNATMAASELSAKKSNVGAL